MAASRNGEHIIGQMRSSSLKRFPVQLLAETIRR